MREIRNTLFLIIIFVFALSAEHISELQNLGKLVESQGKFIGTLVTSKELHDTSYARIVASTCNMITVGYNVWTSRAQKDKYIYGYADSVIAFAQKNGMTLRAEDMVGDVLLPSWLRTTKYTSDQLSEILRTEIAATAGHYKGKIYAWEVLNELFNEDGSFRNYTKGGWSDDGGKFRNSLWYEMFHEAYFDTAFQLAHEYDPQARLFLSDFNCEELNKKSDGMFTLVSNFKKRGIPIDGISFQCHLVLENLPNWESFRKNIQRFETLGMEIHFSEVDIRITNPVTPEKLEKQANAYSRLLSLFLSEKKCTMFVMWGMHDKYSWIPNYSKGKCGAACIFDSLGNPKPSYYSILKVLQQNNSVINK
jgi:endo-1,4-beta-xylanase